LLRWLVFYPLLLAVLIRWGVPPLAARLMAQFQFDLVPYYPLLMSFVLLMTPMLAGMVIGFLLLDQRDDQTLTALQVTPLTLNGYLVYRISMPIVLSLAITLIIFPMAGLVEIGFVPLLLAALSAAPLAPFYALSLAAIAANKVQGFALTKALGVLLVPPVMAYFVPTPWQWFFGLVPLYWPAKLIWLLHAGETSYWFYLLIGLLYQFLLLIVLLRRFNKAMHL
jgi:fluoroquinolone transport system permease protein